MHRAPNSLLFTFSINCSFAIHCLGRLEASPLTSHLSPLSQPQCFSSVTSFPHRRADAIHTPWARALDLPHIMVSSGVSSPWAKDTGALATRRIRTHTLPVHPGTRCASGPGCQWPRRVLRPLQLCRYCSNKHTHTCCVCLSTFASMAWERAEAGRWQRHCASMPLSLHSSLAGMAWETAAGGCWQRHCASTPRSRDSRR